PWSLPMPGPAAIMAVLAIASLSTAFAYALYFRVLSTAGATNASLVTMLIPPGAIIMGILVLDETVLPRHLVGLALIIAGLLVTDGRIRLPRRG
ncbi:MAG: DMT family transporter, partial [Pseudomonadota bacterium]|nr:DMT family transporter [Pseudomonadota bacterium]